MMKYYLTDTSFLEDPAVFQNRMALAGTERRKKIMKYRFDRDRRLSLAAVLLLQKGLKESGLSERERKHLRVKTGKEGKPYLPDYPDLHFNVSHSGEMVMCVLADCPVGCDIQEVTDISEDMVQHFFHPEEYRQMMILPKEQRQEFALQLWVMKEAYVKALGLGITGLPFDRFEIQQNFSTDQGQPGRQSAAVREGKRDTEAVFPVIPESVEGYRLAVCCRKNSG